MDSDSIFMLLAMILLVALSAFFSATETAYTSFNRIKLKSLAASGNRSAAKVLKLDEKYERLLTAILVGNNIANISLTTISTMFFMKTFSEKLNDDAIAAVSTAVVTIVILIFGEISPKAIAKDHADGYVLSTHGIISFLITILFPITILFSAWKKLLNIIFKSGKREATTEDELITMGDEAEHDGGLDEDESDKSGRVIRQERYAGTCSRSFYVGDVKPEDVKAKYESGILTITLPKAEQKKLSSGTSVTIE